jgi:hypothetical protein
MRGDDGREGEGKRRRGDLLLCILSTFEVAL